MRLGDIPKHFNLGITDGYTSNSSKKIGVKLFLVKVVTIIKTGVHVPIGMVVSACDPSTKEGEADWPLL